MTSILSSRMTTRLKNTARRSRRSSAGSDGKREASFLAAATRFLLMAGLSPPAPSPSKTSASDSQGGLGLRFQPATRHRRIVELDGQGHEHLGAAKRLLPDSGEHLEVRPR